MAFNNIVPPEAVIPYNRDMTLRHERVNAIARVREFLYDLCRPGKLPGKKELRHQIRYLLKHYPNEWEIGFLPDMPTEAQRKAFRQFTCQADLQEDLDPKPRSPRKQSK